jgi:hypothetical protein
MSEEEQNLVDAENMADQAVEEAEALPEVEDFDQNGLLLKIATNGLSIPDYVKKLKESDILVAIDGHIYRDGPAKLREMFMRGMGEESKWLLTLWLICQSKVSLGLRLSKKLNGPWRNFISILTAILSRIKTMKFIETGTIFVMF